MTELGTESLHVPAHAPPRLRPRVLVRGDVIFEPVLSQLSEVADLGFGYECAADAEPAQRTVTVGWEWQPLLKGLQSWVDDWGGPPSLLVVENLHGLDRQVIPTPAERAAEAAHVLELGVRVGNAELGYDVARSALVRPGRTLPVEPADPLYVRCPAGPVRVRVAALPPGDLPAAPVPPDAPLGPRRSPNDGNHGDRPADHPYREA